MRLSLSTGSAILVGTFALWVSFGTLAVTGAEAGSVRVGVLPSPLWLLAAGAIVAIAARGAGSRAVVFWLSSVLLLPWLPLPVPPAAFIWSGPIRWWIWSVIAIALLAPPFIRRLSGVRALADPRRAVWIAGTVAAVVYLATAWQIRPQLPGGDEPHYLVITQSLLKDGDLKIENNHAREDYRAYVSVPIRPDFLKRGTDGEIYSVHAPGLPAIVAPVFALLGYPGVLAFLALVAGCTAALVWRASWLVTGDVAASWFGWAAISLTVPFLFQAFTVYPDGVGAAFVMAGIVTLLRAEHASPRLLAATGFALALLPWLHSRFAVTACALGVTIVARQLAAPDRLRRIAAFVAFPIAGAAAWFTFFYVIYGTPNPTVAYGGYTQTAAANIPRSLTGLWLDEAFGILPNAPVYLCAVMGLAALARRRSRAAIELAFVFTSYALAAALFFMWWGGFASPARFLVSVLVLFAIPAAAWFADARPITRLFGLATLVLSLAISASIAAVGRGVLLYNVRTAPSKLFVWASPVVDLTRGLPSMFQSSTSATFASGTIWIAAALATAALAVWLSRRGASLAAATVAVGLTGTALATAAIAVTWRITRAEPLLAARAGARLLRAMDDDARQVLLQYAPFGRVDATTLVPRLHLFSRPAEPARPEDPLLSMIDPPAATYSIEATLTGEVAALTGGLDRQPAPLWKWDLSGHRGPWRQTFTLDTDAHALRFDTDAAARTGIGSIAVRPVRRLPSRERVTNRQAWRAARYGPATVFLLDGRSYIEAAGAWIVGGSWADFAMVLDADAPLRLLVRNSGIANTVTLTSGAWKERLELKAGEERLFDVPVVGGRRGAVLRVSASTGARPFDVDPTNLDKRFLGVWIETR